MICQDLHFLVSARRRERFSHPIQLKLEGYVTTLLFWLLLDPVAITPILYNKQLSILQGISSTSSYSSSSVLPRNWLYVAAAPAAATAAAMRLLYYVVRGVVAGSSKERRKGLNFRICRSVCLFVARASSSSQFHLYSGTEVSSRLLLQPAMVGAIAEAGVVS